MKLQLLSRSVIFLQLTQIPQGMLPIRKDIGFFSVIYEEGILASYPQRIKLLSLDRLSPISQTS